MQQPTYTDTQIDTLFAPPVPEPEPTMTDAARVSIHIIYITCCVCLSRFTGFATRPAPLCPACVADIGATRQHVEDVVATAERAWETAQSALDHAITEADPALQKRWHRLLAARRPSSGVDDATLAQRIEATRQLGDGLAQLLTLEDQVVVLADSTNAIRDWGRKAQAALEAWPPEVQP